MYKVKAVADDTYVVLADHLFSRKFIKYSYVQLLGASKQAELVKPGYPG